MTALDLLTLKNLRYSHRRAAAPAVDGVSLTVRPGETLALVGESGSGKSTLARALAGLLPVHEGDIRFDGVHLAWRAERRNAAIRRRVQIIFQNPDRSLNPRHTVATILGRPLRLLLRLNGRALEARVAELLSQVRLPATYKDRYPSELSGGERQRVAIARALAAEPSLLLCDEVISALDVSVQAAVLELLQDLQARAGLAMLFITHDLAVVRWFADRVAVLYRGVLCEIGPAAALFEAVRHPYTGELLAAVPVVGRRPDFTTASPSAFVEPPAPDGCRFASRCQDRIGGLCDRVAPPWRDAGPDHQIRCHLDVEALRSPREASALPRRLS